MYQLYQYQKAKCVPRWPLDSTPEGPIHYCDVIQRAMASQITGVSTACWTVCSGAVQRKHKSSAALALVMGICRFPSQKTSNTEIASFWWRHHEKTFLCYAVIMVFSTLRSRCFIHPGVITNTRSSNRDLYIRDCQHEGETLTYCGLAHFTNIV